MTETVLHSTPKTIHLVEFEHKDVVRTWCGRFGLPHEVTDQVLHCQKCKRAAK